MNFLYIMNFFIYKEKNLSSPSHQQTSLCVRERERERDSHLQQNERLTRNRYREKGENIQNYRLTQSLQSNA